MPLLWHMRKINRLLSNDDFTRVLNGGNKIKEDSFLVACVPNSLGHLRVGISVSKKVGNAVTRVRIRRQVRAIIGSLDLIAEQVDLVILPKPGFLKKSHGENLASLKNAVTVLLNRRRK